MTKIAFSDELGGFLNDEKEFDRRVRFHVRGEVAPISAEALFARLGARNGQVDWSREQVDVSFDRRSRRETPFSREKRGLFGKLLKPNTDPSTLTFRAKLPAPRGNKPCKK